MRMSDWSSDVCSSDLVRASAIGNHRLAETDVGRLVAAEDAARALLGHTGVRVRRRGQFAGGVGRIPGRAPAVVLAARDPLFEAAAHVRRRAAPPGRAVHRQRRLAIVTHRLRRSEEQTSELQSLMRISYAVFCLKNKNNINTND